MSAVANGNGHGASNGELRQRNASKQNGNGIGHGAVNITEEGRKRDQELDKHDG